MIICNLLVFNYQTFKTHTNYLSHTNFFFFLLFVSFFFVCLFVWLAQNKYEWLMGWCRRHTIHRNMFSAPLILMGDWLESIHGIYAVSFHVNVFFTRLFSSSRLGAAAAVNIDSPLRHGCKRKKEKKKPDERRNEKRRNIPKLARN